MARMRIVLTGGGSGGHIYPLLAVAESLRKLQPELDLHYLGPNDRFAAILDGVGIPRHRVAGSKMRRYASGIFQNILDIPRFALGLIQSFVLLLWLMPDVVFSKGGPGALPVVGAAWFYRIPVIIHESDAVPGITNLVSARFARRIAVSFDSALLYFRSEKTSLTGQPIRIELSAQIPDQALAKQELNYDFQLPLVLVLGGSQGSVRINDFLLVNLEKILPATQILHQTGADNFNDVQALARVKLMELPEDAAIKSRYQPVPFVEDLKTALAAADLVVSRSSSTVFEIASFSKPMILIPLPESANDHQRQNAFAFVKLGAAIIIEEPNLKPDLFLHEVRRILEDPAVKANMGAAALKSVQPNASQKIAQLILEAAK